MSRFFALPHTAVAVATPDKLALIQHAREKHARLLFGSGGPYRPEHAARLPGESGAARPQVTAEEPATGGRAPTQLEGGFLLLEAADSARADLLRREQHERRKNLMVVSEAIAQLVDLSVEELELSQSGVERGGRRTAPSLLLRQQRDDRPLQLLANREGLHLGWEQFPGNQTQLDRLRDDLMRLGVSEVFASVPREVQSLQQLVGTLQEVETSHELDDRLRDKQHMSDLLPPAWVQTPDIAWQPQMERLAYLLHERVHSVAARERQGTQVVSQLLWMPPSMLQHVWPHVLRTLDHGFLLRSMIQVGKALTLTQQWAPLAGLVQVTAWLASHHPLHGLRRAYWVQTDQLLGHRALRATGNQLTPVLGDLVRSASLHRLQEHWLAFLLGRLAVTEDREERMRLLPSLRRLATESATLEHMLLDSRWYVVRNAIDVVAHGGIRRYWPMIRAARAHPEPRVQAMAEQVIADGLLPAQ